MRLDLRYDHGYGHLYVSVAAYTFRFRLFGDTGIDLQLSSHRFTKRTPYWFWRFPWKPRPTKQEKS